MVYNEEIIPIPVGLGLDLYRHPANIQDGFCPEIVNMIAEGDSLVTRKGFQHITEVDTRESYVTIGLDNFYVRLPYSSDADIPVGFYSMDGTVYAIRQFDRDNPSSTDSDPGVREFSALSNLNGACTYLSKLYCNRAGIIYSLTAFDWSLGTVTQTSVGGPGVGATTGLFVFKDRLWTWTNTTIYYTDAPASAGAYPETWSASGNFLVITSEKGQCKIFSIIPSGNQLFVFTTSGLFTINVSGAPLNWYPRLVDSTVTVNHHSCAYEHQGLVYFIDPRGVYVTNGSEVHKISEPIETVFRETIEDEFYLYKLFPFEDGILICKAKFYVEGTFPAAINRFLSDAEIYYTRLDNVAWSKFELSTTSQFMDIIGGWSRLETKNDWQGSSYIAAGFGRSTSGSPNDGSIELLKYTGFQDVIRREAEAIETSAITASFRTRIIRGEMFQSKRAKYAYINMSVTGTDPIDWSVSYTWNTEGGDAIETGTITSEVNSQLENLIKIKADFHYRFAWAEVSVTLTSDVLDYTFLGLGIVNHTNRREPRTAS